jgi:hypothetical protein
LKEEKAGGSIQIGWSKEVTGNDLGVCERCILCSKKGHARHPALAWVVGRRIDKWAIVATGETGLSIRRAKEQHKDSKLRRDEWERALPHFGLP